MITSRSLHLSRGEPFVYPSFFHGPFLQSVSVPFLKRSRGKE